MSSEHLTIFKTLQDGTIEYRDKAQTRVVINHPPVPELVPMQPAGLNVQNIGISGSWRNVLPIVEHDVVHYVRWLIVSGHTLVTGGALGVDEIATAEAIRLKAQPHQLRVWLPTPLDVYLAHFRNRAKEGVIKPEQAETLATQLQFVKANYRLFTLDHRVCNEDTYYDRNGKVIDDSDSLTAFHVDNSQGVQDAIDKARARDMPVTVKTYKTRPRRTTPFVFDE